MSSADEGAALNIARQRFEAQGGHWQGTAIPSVSAARSTAVNRILGGKPPAVFQTSVGQQLRQLDNHAMIAAAPVDAAHLDAILPPLIADAAKIDGRYMAVPAYIRGENWMFFNRQVLEAVGVSPPTTWIEFIAAAKKLKAHGITPIALGGQPWQERILFNAVLLGVGGRAFYRKVYIDRDPIALDSPTLGTVFEVFASLRAYVDPGSPGRPWNQATAMLIRGDAAFQFIGDWAKAEITASGLVVGDQIGCVLAPAPEASYIVAVDAFAFPSASDAAGQAGQRLFVRTILDPQVQARMSKKLGSIPVSADAAPEGFDVCARQALALARAPDSLLPSTGLFALSGSDSGAVDDAISLFWHDSSFSPAAGKAMFKKAMLARAW